MIIRMYQRRGTTAEWAAANPILGAGEIGLDLSVMQIKIGDGSTAWLDLDFYSSPSTFVPTAIASGDTFTVPADAQALFKHPISIGLGTLHLIGALLEVS